MCENTRFFPIALSLLSCMSIEPLMHSEYVWFARVFKLPLHCLAFLHVNVLIPKTQLSTQTFCLVESKFIQIKVMSWKILEKSSNLPPKKCMNSLTFHVHSIIAANHTYNCQQRQYMRISILIFFIDHHIEKCLSLEKFCFFHCPVLSFQCKLWLI